MADSQNHAYQKAHLDDDKKTEIIAPTVIFLAIAFTAVFLRYTSRHVSRLRLGADDWCIGLGLVRKECQIVMGKLLTPPMDCDRVLCHHLLSVHEIWHGKT